MRDVVTGSIDCTDVDMRQRFGIAYNRGYMRVVTLEGFARHDPDFEGHRGYVYYGDAWLFRFVIESAEDFFRIQLPYVVDVFNIDPRQIYRLALYGQPGCGLSDVRLFISFEEPPDEGTLERLQITPPQTKTDRSGDILDDLLIEVLLVASDAAKRRLGDALTAGEPPLKTRSLGKGTRTGDFISWRRGGSRYGSLVRLHWTDELSPRAADWNNTNFILSESLRASYDPKNIARLEFRALPETEHAYDIEAEILVAPSVRLNTIRTTPKKKPRPPGIAKRTKGGGLVFQCVLDPANRLSESDRLLRNTFNGLSLEKRIGVWHRHIAEFFR